ASPAQPDRTSPIARPPSPRQSHPLPASPIPANVSRQICGTNRHSKQLVRPTASISEPERRLQIPPRLQQQPNTQNTMNIAGNRSPSKVAFFSRRRSGGNGAPPKTAQSPPPTPPHPTPPEKGLGRGAPPHSTTGTRTQAPDPDRQVGRGGTKRAPPRQPVKA